MTFFDFLKSRHLVDSCTCDDAKMAALLETPQTLYIGFDPTASCLQAGNYVAIQTLAQFQRAGHHVIALVGGATGMIGDPSGRSTERNFLSVEQLQKNLEGIKENLSRFLDFNRPGNPARLVNNYDWYKDYAILPSSRRPRPSTSASTPPPPASRRATTSPSRRSLSSNAPGTTSSPSSAAPPA